MTNRKMHRSYEVMRVGEVRVRCRQCLQNRSQLKRESYSLVVAVHPSHSVAFIRRSPFITGSWRMRAKDKRDASHICKSEEAVEAQ
jgi:hypothetical protein